MIFVVLSDFPGDFLFGWARALCSVSSRPCWRDLILPARLIFTDVGDHCSRYRRGSLQQGRDDNGGVGDGFLYISDVLWIVVVAGGGVVGYSGGNEAQSGAPRNFRLRSSSRKTPCSGNFPLSGIVVTLTLGEHAPTIRDRNRSTACSFICATLAVKATLKHMFIGEYHHQLDDKGRLAIPVKFRGDLAKGAVVTRGLDSSLFLLPLEEWGKLADSLANLPLGQANSRAFSRLMLAGAMDVKFDKQGRFIVPEYLRKYGKLDKKVVIVGVSTRLELWDAATWEAYSAQTQADAEAIAEQLGDLGI